MAETPIAITFQKQHGMLLPKQYYTLILALLCIATTSIAQDFSAVSFGTTSDYISTDWNPEFGEAQDFSVEFSIRTDGWSSDPAVLSDKDWGSGGNPGFNIALASNNAGIDVNVGDGSNRADLASGSINDGGWHHVLVSFDRDGQLAMYIDGVLTESTDMSGVGNINSPFNFNMGQDGTGNYGQAATCAITNVRIYDLAIAFDDVADIACNEITPGHPLFGNLIHYWTLQEGTGTTAADAIGGQDGTFQGSVNWLEGFFPDLMPSFTSSIELSTVEFTNTSTDATSFAWDFGDGNTSTLENPTHTYLTTGAFEVSFTVGNACETQTLTETITITTLNDNLQQSIDLDGADDFVQLTNDLNFGDTEDFTIELLVRSEGWTSDPSIIANKDWGSGSNPGFILAGKGDGSTWKVNIGDGSSRIDLDGGVINDGLWHHIAVTYDQDGAKKLYHDGVVFEESTTILGNINTTLDLAIGQDGTLSYGAFFAGQVAEVRIWGAVLDSMTLADNLCGADSEHPNNEDLIHYWKLDEGTGTVITDSEGDNDGTYNGEWTTTLFTLNCGDEDPDANFNAAQLASTSREDYLTTDWDPAFGSDLDFSIDFRIKSLGWNGDPAIVSDKDWNSGSNPGFVLAFNGNSIKVNAGSGSARADVNGGKVMNDGAWHHVLATFDRDGDLELFLDGISQGTAPLDGVVEMNSPHTLKIGSDGTGDYPIGFSTTGPTSDIAFVRVWDRVVDYDEINVCSTIEETDPIWEDIMHFWKMDEGAGTIAADSKGDQDATWVNNEAWTFFNNYPESEAAFDAAVQLSTVSFVNNSTSGSYFWDFGDGETSDATNPSHLYFNTGTFDVTLVVEGTCSTDTITQTVEILELDQNLLTSLDLDGSDDFVLFDNALNPGATGDFTIELYVKSTGWTSDPSIISNKDWGSGGNPGFIIAGKGDGTTWKFNIGDGSSRIDLDGGVINDDQWHHIAVSYDADGTKAIYQDGELAAETTTVLGDVNSMLDLAIGQDGTSTYGAFFNGQIAEVRIWEAALNGATLEDYLCGVDDSHPAIDQLLHYWRCDEGMGTDIADSEGVNTGVYNGAWTVTSNGFDACEINAPVNDIGAGNAVEFDQVDDWIDCSGAEGAKVSAESLNLPTQDLTLECWVKPNSYTIWHAMVGFLQDNGSFERGWDLELRDDKKFAFALKTEGNSSLTYLETGNTFEENQWYHIAGVYDGTEQKIYVNGVLEATATSQSGAIDYADSWLALGMYKDDNENFSIDGTVDEVRIWSTAKTEEEIRASMCAKLSGNEDNLVAYYRLDNLAGEEIRDYGPNNLTGQMQNMAPATARVISGAALGDASVYAYEEDWTDIELELSADMLGTVSLSELEGNFLKGAHLYQVNELPNSAAGVFDIGDNEVYYGTFMVDRSGVLNYDLEYDYSDYPTATANEASLNLYNRPDNAITTWFNAGASLDTDADLLSIENIGSRREIILSDFSAVPCAAPQNIMVDVAGFNEITLSWASSAATFNIEWGPAGFVFGTGTLIEANAGTSIEITGLDAATVYEVYVQADCGSGSTSAWTGPITIATDDPCQAPFNVETTDITTSSAVIRYEAVETVSAFDLQWGTAGFPLGQGILVSTDADTVQLEFLPMATELEYYLRSNCDADFGVLSDWVGPFAFSTLMVGTEDLAPGIRNFNVFPNPTSSFLQIQIDAEEQLKNVVFIVYNKLGQEVYRQAAGSSKAFNETLDVQTLTSGLYLLKMTSEQHSLIRTFTVQ